MTDDPTSSPESRRQRPGSAGPAAVSLSRVLSGAQLTAAGLIIPIGVGVYTALGAFVGAFPAASVQTSFLLLALMAIPIALTLADSAALSRRSGIYGLVRNQPWLALPFLTGWLLIGAYAILLAILAQGTAIQIDLLLAGTNITLPQYAPAGGVLTLFAFFKLLGASAGWRRSTLIVGGATLTVLLLAGAGLILERTARALPQYLARDALAIDVSVMTATALLGVALWGMLMIVELRGRIVNRAGIRRPMFISVLVFALVAGSSVLAVGRFLGQFDRPQAPLLTFAREGVLPLPALFQIAYMLFGLGVLLLGLDQILTSAIRLTESMTDDGFVAQRLERLQGRVGTPILPVLGVTLLALLLVLFFDTIDLLAMAACIFFWTVAALSLPATVTRGDSAYARTTKLPFHPLIPGFVIAIGLFMPLSLNVMNLAWAAAWVAGGLFLFVAYARRSGLEQRRSAMIDSEEIALPTTMHAPAPAGGGAGDSILVLLSAADNATRLIELGVRLAATRQAKLIVLRVLQIPEQTAFDVRRRLVQREFDSLQATVDEIETAATSVQPLVRLGVSRLDGILDVITHERSSLLLAGWSGHMSDEETPADPLVDILMRSAPCDVLALRGAPPAAPERVVVATAGGPHSVLATELAVALRADDDYQLRLLHVLPKESETAEKQIGAAAFEACAAAVGEEALEQEMIGAESIEAGIVQGADGSDLLILGAAKKSAFIRSRFRGMPVRIAANMARPVLVVRAKEEVRHPAIARTWELLSDPLPSLTAERRKAVTEQMVASAEPSVDFFVLIILASVIASFGLLQNSAAVIIGAMLVAPLMSPILAMAMAIVRGDLALLSTAAEATAQGVFLAIVVGVMAVFVSPIDAPTNEILARTRPNVLDLMVALASGAAAGYAVSRAQVAAALPGVAIAAALVPPLCVVGYGIGSSQLAYSGGALLLFTTNLVAIVLSAALIFLALGFYPRHTGRSELWAMLRIPVLSLVLIAAALTFVTVMTVRDANARSEIERILSDSVQLRGGEVQSLVIRREEGRYVAEATLLLTDPDAWTPAAAARVQQTLDERIGGQTEIVAVIHTAERYDERSYQTFVAVDAYLEEQVTSRGGAVRDLRVAERGDAVHVETTLVAPQESRLDAAVMESIRRGLEETLRQLYPEDFGAASVQFEATILRGDYAELQPSTGPD